MSDSHLHNNQFNIVFNKYLKPFFQFLLDLQPALAFLISPGLHYAASYDSAPPSRDAPGDVTAGLVDLPAREVTRALWSSNISTVESEGLSDVSSSPGVLHAKILNGFGVFD